MAGGDDPARQGDGGAWPIFRKRERWPLSQAQDFAEGLKWGGPLSGMPIDLAHELLTQSLAAWRVVGSVRREGDGVIVICGSHKDIQIARALDCNSRRPQARRDLTRGRSPPSAGGTRSRLCGQPRPGRGQSIGAIAMSVGVIPVSVLTGFLGSGKTTLLGYLLRQPEFSRTAVIINELDAT